MTKNDTKIPLLAATVCIIIFGVFFAIRTNGRNIPGIVGDYYSYEQSNLKASAVDLNNATVEELDAIPGIGKSLAQKIVDYREKYGDYVDVEELLDIQGLSEELYDQILQYITLGGSS